MVVANSSSIAALLHLLWALRCLHAPVAWKTNTREVGHCFSTSLSTIAYDYRIDECAAAAKPPRPARLVAEARVLAKQFSEGPRVSLDPVSVQTAFSVFPGHEALLSKVFTAAEKGLARATGGKRPAGQGASGIVGRADLAGPVIRTPDQLSEVEALLYSRCCVASPCAPTPAREPTIPTAY